MLKCNNTNSSREKRLLYDESELLCVKGVGILTKTTTIKRNQQVVRPNQHKEREKIRTTTTTTASEQREQRTRVCARKTLQPNIVASFNEQICGELLQQIRACTGDLDELKSFLLQTDVEVVSKTDQQLKQKYSHIYDEFFGVHYEHLKSLLLVK